MNQWEINQVLKFHLELIKDENPYEINMFEPSISVAQAKEMFSQIPKIKAYLEENEVKKPLTLRSR